jgi:hypothetical protein
MILERHSTGGATATGELTIDDDAPVADIWMRNPLGKNCARRASGSAPSPRVLHP